MSWVDEKMSCVELTGSSEIIKKLQKNQVNEVRELVKSN